MYERLSSQPESLVSYRISDRLTSNEFDEISNSLKKDIESYGRLKMLVEIDHLDFPSPGVVWEDLKFAYRHAKDFDRFAVLGDKNWEKWWVRVADKIVSTECRYFDSSEKDQAFDWVTH